MHRLIYLRKSTDSHGRFEVHKELQMEGTLLSLFELAYKVLSFHFLEVGLQHILGEMFRVVQCAKPISGCHSKYDLCGLTLLYIGYMSLNVYGSITYS